MASMHADRVDGRTRRGRERRDVILAATCRLVVRDGLDGIRTATVAAEAGSSVGLIHYHYPTLDDLVLAAYVWDEQRVWDPFGELDPDVEPLGTLGLLLAGQLAQPEAEVRAGFMLWQEYARRAVFDERIREVVVRRIERWVGVMEGLIRAAAGRGAYVDAGGAEVAAPRFAALLFGASVLHLIGLIPVERAAADMAVQLERSAITASQPAVAVAPVPVSPAAAEPTEPAERILDATLALIAEDGVRAVHFADVGDMAGCSTTLPRYYFSTMDGLLAAAFARFTDRRLERVRRLVDTSTDRRERVRLAVAGLTSMDSANGHDDLVIWHEFLRLGFIRDDVRPAVCAAGQSDIDELHALLTEAADVADAAAAARHLVELSNGVGLGCLLGILDAERAVRIIDWAVADALDAGD